MGFTRNYKNAVLCSIGGGFRNTTANQTAITDKFDDTVFNTFKNVKGVIEYNTRSITYGRYTATNSQTAASYLYDIPVCELGHLICESQKNSSGTYTTPIIYFGTGDTPESIEDYTITKASISFLEYPVITGNAFDETGITNSFQMVIQSTTDVVLKELGLFARFYTFTQPNGGNQSSEEKMLYRKVLDTPIELTANVPQLVTFDIHIPNITI